MKLNLSHFTTLVALLFGFGLSAQPARDADDRLVDNSLRFHVISEKVHTRGMMEICISDSTGNGQKVDVMQWVGCFLSYACHYLVG